MANSSSLFYVLRWSAVSVSTGTVAVPDSNRADSRATAVAPNATNRAFHLSSGRRMADNRERLGLSKPVSTE